MIKKILLGIVGIIFVGCGSLPPVGSTSTYKSKTYTRITENITRVKDSVTLDEYVSASSSSSISAGILTGKFNFASFEIRVRKQDTSIIFHNIDELTGETYAMINRGAIFSDGETVAEVRIRNLSNVDRATEDNVILVKTDLEKLYKIFSGSRPITIRMSTNQGTYDVQHDDKYRQGIVDILEMALEKK